MIFILMQIKLISTLASFWKWGFLELGSGRKVSLRTVIWTCNKQILKKWRLKSKVEDWQAAAAATAAVAAAATDDDDDDDDDDNDRSKS